MIEKSTKETTPVVPAPAGPAPFGVGLAAWVVPGLGHLLMGKKARAALFFASVATLFWLGVILKGHFTYANDPVESFALFKFVSHLSAGFHFAVTLLTGVNADAYAMKARFSNEIGATCLYLAGIINLLCVLDAIAIRRGKKE